MTVPDSPAPQNAALTNTIGGRPLPTDSQGNPSQPAAQSGEHYFQELVQQAADCFYLHDAEGRLLDVNQRTCATLGYSRAEMLHMHLSEVVIDLKPHSFHTLIDPAFTGQSCAFESRHRHRDGGLHHIELRTGPVDLCGGRHLLSLARDITERKLLQGRIEHLAYHDALTDLPNRAMFSRHLDHALVQAIRYRKRLALLFIDLDRFKEVNDSLGHDAGDTLLRHVARRLTGTLRRGDLVARLGGDEFVVVLEEITGLDQVAQVARQVSAAVEKPFLLAGRSATVGASIGISMYPENGNNATALMRHADAAMYRAKRGTKNSVPCDARRP